MASVRYNERLGVKGILCLYIIVSNSFAMGALRDSAPLVNASPATAMLSSASPSDRGIAFYASDKDCYDKMKGIINLFCYAAQLYSELSVISLAIPDFNTSPEVKEAEQKVCNNLIKELQCVIRGSKDYVETIAMFDQYNAIVRRLNETCVTSQRQAELKTTLENLEQRFEGKKQLASYVLAYGVSGYYENHIGPADGFIRKYKS
ncbi:TRAP dicarboxylate family transporter subunit, putative [Babesia ovata]|uniref:TRAP dicarboxylate family transporter subunit, putative n=1 Tax=Babesia ovata TaxID=189622 RepID=A0A2H6KBX8_9APIC|nr:TRAP dicarboxylate family transporter subunit, putative [Babesia ovata]GBE60492.1 TRAP dicarboxylate family transporter subunit, putative [Babesia ovata]